MAATFRVDDFGAKADGTTDATQAAQDAIDAVAKAGAGRVHFPAGAYRLTRSLVLPGAMRCDVTGDGQSTRLLHENEEPVLLWPEGSACRESSVRNLNIHSTTEKAPDVPAIAVLGGAERSLFTNILFDGPTSSGIWTERVIDTTTIEHCLFWGGVAGTGIRCARGSEVRIIGGRIIGAHGGKAGTGIHLTENNGGVHVVTTDIIGLETGMKIGEPGNQSNREIFITHATFDGCGTGLWQVDHSYTSIAGCWAASSDEAQILVDESARGAILAIAGGTIFNGGAWNRPGAHHGMVVRAGSFTLSGVTVRNNKGIGLLVEEGVRDYAVTGCRIAENGTGAVLRGDSYAFTGNVLARNGEDLADEGGPTKEVAHNVIRAQTG